MSKTQRLRDQLYLLQGSRCFYCDKAIVPDDRSLEHVIPSCEGGLADANNAVVVCEAANQLLGSATPKQKMIMLKAGNGKIECPKKCANGTGYNDAYDDVAIPVNPQKQERAAIQQANEQRNRARKQNQKGPSSNAPQAGEQQAQTDVQGATPMTAKQKHKARSGHQFMPKPAAGRRRR